MAKKRDLDWIVEDRRAEVRLYGERAADRYDDDELSILGEWPIEDLSLINQQITHLPPLQTSLRRLWLRDNYSLASIEGIEKLTGLQSLTLGHSPALDLDRAFELFAELPELTELGIGGRTLHQLPHGIAKLPSVLDVSLDNAPGMDLRDAFATLGKLKTLRNLHVWASEREIPDALEPLAKIEVLEVRGTGKVFPASVGKLANLKKLLLERSEFAALPPTIGKLTQLEELVIKGVPITELPDEICDCASLVKLDADDTLLKTLPEQIGKLSKLRFLAVWGKKFKTLPESIGDLAELRSLRLPSMRRAKLVVPDSIYKLQLEEFIGPQEIEDKLTMRPPPTPEEDRVRIYDADRIPADFGDPCELDISLSEYDGTLPQLSKLRRLEELEIHVKNLDDALEQLAAAPKLRVLKINTGDATLPDSLGGLVSVESLSIDSGDPTYSSEPGTLKSLPDAIGKLVNLKNLRIERNGLKKLPDAIGKLAALEDLHLQHADELEALPKTIGALKRLKSLFLSSPDKLKRLPAELAQCKALESFTIRCARKIENADILGKLPALRFLTLAYGGYPIDDVLDVVPGVEALDLSDAHLEKLPKSIGKLAKLRKLELDGNDIKRLPAELRDCTELRWISLSLYKLDEDVRNSLKDHLPKGRWKKNYRSGRTWWERSS